MKKKVPPELRFDERLATLRKVQALTQQALAFTLRVNADMHLLAADEGGPDDDRKLRFKAACRLNPEEKDVFRSGIEGIIPRTERRFTDAGESNR